MSSWGSRTRDLFRFRTPLIIDAVSFLWNATPRWLPCRPIGSISLSLPSLLWGKNQALGHDVATSSLPGTADLSGLLCPAGRPPLSSSSPHQDTQLGKSFPFTSPPGQPLPQLERHPGKRQGCIYLVLCHVPSSWYNAWYEVSINKLIVGRKLRRRENRTDRFPKY